MLVRCSARVLSSLWQATHKKLALLEPSDKRRAQKRKAPLRLPEVKPNNLQLRTRTRKTTTLSTVAQLLLQLCARAIQIHFTNKLKLLDLFAQCKAKLKFLQLKVFHYIFVLSENLFDWLSPSLLCFNRKSITEKRKIVA